MKDVLHGIPKKLDFHESSFMITYIEIFTCCAFQPNAEDSGMF